MCRFEMTVADALLGYQFCVFEFSGWRIQAAQHTVRTVGSLEDPMKSATWLGLVARFPSQGLVAGVRVCLRNEKGDQGTPHGKNLGQG